MKRPFHYILALILVMIMYWTSATPINAEESKGTGKEIEGTTEETNPSENKTNAIDLVNEQIDNINLAGIQKYWDQIVNEYGGFLPESQKGSLVDFIKASGDFNFSEWISGVINYLFHEFIVNGKLLGSLILLTIFSMFLQSIQNSFEKSTVSKIAYSIVFIVLMIIALNSFNIAIQYASDAIENMIHYTLAFIPLLLALMATSGGVISAGFFHPVVLFLTNISGIFVNYIILPLLFLSALLSIVSTLTDHYKATQLAGLLRNWSIGLLGVFMTVFLSVISIQGTATAVADGVAVKTAKFVTGNFIPVVGRMFTDAADTVISASSLLKNTIGLAGVAILLLLILFPAIKILIIAFIFKFAAALLQPLGGGPIISCLDVISKCIIYLFAALSIVSIMFFLSITVIVMAGNFTIMVR